MSFLSPLGIQRHHRSASAEMDLVMDFSQSGDMGDSFPIPRIHRRPEHRAEELRKVSVKNSPVRQRSLTCTMAEYHEDIQQNRGPAPDSGSEQEKITSNDSNRDAMGKAMSPESRCSTCETVPVNTQTSTITENLQMSLVSPPFTPTASQVDLGHALASPEPISLPSTASASMRAKLDDTLPEVFCESRARIPTTNGVEIFLHVYRNNVDTKEHLAIVFGQDIHSKTLFAKREGETEHDRMTRGAYTGKLYPGRQTSGPESELPELQASEPAHSNTQDVLCRIHSECYTGETAWSARCDCGEQLDEAARLMSEAGRGVIVYLRQEGRGIGLGEKLKAYNLQDLGADTVQANLLLRHPADGRSFGLATAILLDLGLDHIRLMTNNPDKIVAVEGKNKEIKVTQRVPMIPLSWQKKGGFQSAEVDKYLTTKIERMGHLLDR